MTGRAMEDIEQVYAQALAAHEQGDVAAAVELYGKILLHFPDADVVLYNQGLALFDLERYAEAAQVLAQAAELRKDDADTWYNLALALKQGERYAEAVDAYTQALVLQPDDRDVLFNLANCCRESGDAEQAATVYTRLLELEPEHASALNNFAYLCHRQQDYSQAEELYLRLLELEPDHAGALHMLAALRGDAEEAPEKAYVRDLFDQYSDSFEQSLVEKLEYRVPELLAKLVSRILSKEKEGDKKIYQHGLDLGCGTGLAGEFFKSSCAQLTGVDLSEKMIAQATDKNLYHRLVADDVVHFLKQDEQHYDLLMAADLLTYLADLEPLLRAAHQRSAAGALFVFSTEHGEEAQWQVCPTGRFAHHPDYVAEAARRCGWQVLHSEGADLRREADFWVRGDLFVLKKSDLS